MMDAVSRHVTVVTIAVVISRWQPRHPLRRLKFSLMNESPMNVRRWGVVALCFTIALLDGFDSQSIAFIGSAIAEEFGMQAADMMWVITASTVGMGIGAMGLGTRRQDWAQEGGHAGLGLLRRLLADRSACDIPGQIVLLRFLIGPGMGGATPLCPHWPPSTARTNTAEL